MKAQKEAPPDMQCRDDFLLQSKIAKAGATPKDITPEMVKTNFHFIVSCFLCLTGLVLLVHQNYYCS
ncbi:putative vesicle-associated membrane-protein-associated protein [Helianthus annuus]|nr:putative vesicle-associated membrane-protein-associated protein [Helianthus annuus]